MCQNANLHTHTHTHQEWACEYDKAPSLSPHVVHLCAPACSAHSDRPISPHSAADFIGHPYLVDFSALVTSTQKPTSTELGLDLRYRCLESNLMIAAQLQILRWSIRSSLVLALCLGPGVVLSADSGRKSSNTWRYCLRSGRPTPLYLQRWVCRLQWTRRESCGVRHLFL